jgi:WD40 repeat protein
MKRHLPGNLPLVWLIGLLVSLLTCGRGTTQVPMPARHTLPVGAAVSAIAFSADGKFLASGDHDGKVKIWRVVTCKLHVSLSGRDGPVYSVGVLAR